MLKLARGQRELRTKVVRKSHKVVFLRNIGFWEKKERGSDN